MTAAPEPRLYLCVPAATDPAALETALTAGDVACVLVSDADTGSAALVRAAQAQEVAALVPDDPDLARGLGADGVHASGPVNIKRLRRHLGEGIVGVQCYRSAHAAMLAGEAGADYVAFAGTEDAPEGPPDPGLLTWWQVMMTVPCVAMGAIDPADAGVHAQAGADFVAPARPAVWHAPDGAAAAVARAQAALTG